MLRIFLTNLGKYNEGKLIGEWIELPCTDEELEEVLEKIGISDEPDENGNYYEEWFISDYETDIPKLTVREYDNLDELNELVETLEDLDDHDREIIEALISEGYTINEAIDKKYDCRIYYNCNDMEDVAIEYVEETGLLDNIPEHLRDYFDYEAYGRDMDYEGTFIFTNNGNCVEIL